MALIRAATAASSPPGLPAATGPAAQPAAARVPGPAVLVWDNLPTHVGRAMRQLIAARACLTVLQLPAYAPELNPVEGIWSV